jgi:hypothetical protein
MDLKEWGSVGYCGYDSGLTDSIKGKEYLEYVTVSLSRTTQLHVFRNRSEHDSFDVPVYIIYCSQTLAQEVS